MKIQLKSMYGRIVPLYSVLVCLPITQQTFGTFSDSVAQTWSKRNSLSGGAYSIDRGAPKATREEQWWETI